MSSFTAQDLEAGASGTVIAGARSPSSVANSSSQQQRSVGTKAMLAGGRPQAKPQPRTADKPMDETMFVGDAGQSLLLAFESNKDKDASAILIPVFRPSIEWAHRMAALEKEPEPLPVKAPEKASFPIDRWREFRWLHHGEDEVEIWRRIKQQCLAQQPRWQPFLPFWRPVLVEERNASTLRTTKILS
jgi:hypothetical protein